MASTDVVEQRWADAVAAQVAAAPDSETQAKVLRAAMGNAETTARRQRIVDTGRLMGRMPAERRAESGVVQAYVSADLSGAFSSVFLLEAAAHGAAVDAAGHPWKATPTFNALQQFDAVCGETEAEDKRSGLELPIDSLILGGSPIVGRVGWVDVGPALELGSGQAVTDRQVINAMTQNQLPKTGPLVEMFALIVETTVRLFSSGPPFGVQTTGAYTVSYRVKRTTQRLPPRVSDLDPGTLDALVAAWNLRLRQDLQLRPLP